MPNPLEQYLNQFRSQLKGMSAEEREAEVEEARQHLFALIQGRIEAGDSEEFATFEAIRQFGDPQHNGRSISQTWTRGAKNRNTLLRFSHLVLVTLIIGAAITHVSHAVFATGDSMLWNERIRLAGVFIVLGLFAATSLRFKRALRGTFFGLFAGLMLLNSISDVVRAGFLPSLYASYLLELTLFFLSIMCFWLNTPRKESSISRAN